MSMALIGVGEDTDLHFTVKKQDKDIIHLKIDITRKLFHIKKNF